MLIKAGTYRFNDVLTAPCDVGSHLSSGPVYFSMSTVVDDTQYTVDFNVIVPGIDMNGIYLYYEMFSADGKVQEGELKVYDEEDGGWQDGLGEGIKTITIPSEQEVSPEFYTWFTANAVEQKQISGKWRWNDVLETGGIALEQTLNAVTAINYLDESELALKTITEITGIEIGTMGDMQYNFPSVPGFGDYCFVYEVPLDGSPANWKTHLVSVETFDELLASGEIDQAIYSQMVAMLDGKSVYGEGIKTIDFGAEPQTVSADFYNWLTENANPVSEESPIATITYNGSTLAELFPGQIATLKCKGMKMEDDVVVEVAELPETEIPEPKLQEKTATENGEVLPDEGYDGLSKVTVAVESSGGGLAINGIIEQYKVNAGATVNAGDFVEFITKYEGGDTSGTFASGGASYISACKLDDSRVLLAYRDTADTYGKAVVLTVENGFVAVGGTAVFNSGNTSDISATALTDSKVLLAFRNNSDGLGFGTAMVLSVAGTAITFNTPVVFNPAKTDFISAATLTDSKVLLAYNSYAEHNYGYGYAVILTINGTSISLGVTAKYYGENSYGARHNSIAVLTSAKVLIAHYGKTGIGTAIVLTIDGTNLTVGTPFVFGKSSCEYVDAVALTENTVLVAYRDYNFGPNFGRAVVLSVNGTTITAGTAVQFESAVSAYFSVTALTNSKVLVTYRDEGNSNYGTAIILSVNGTAISISSPTVFDKNAVTYSNTVALSENYVLMMYNNGSGAFCAKLISGVTISTPTGGVAVNISVQSATNRNSVGGIAATDGESGETVDVYVVG